MEERSFNISATDEHRLTQIKPVKQAAFSDFSRVYLRSSVARIIIQAWKKGLFIFQPQMNTDRRRLNQSNKPWFSDFIRVYLRSSVARIITNIPT